VAHGDLLAIPQESWRQRRLWRWRRRGQSATSEGFGQDRDVSQSVAFHAPFSPSSSSSKRETKAKLSLITHLNVIFIAYLISSNSDGVLLFLAFGKAEKFFLLNLEFKTLLRYDVLYPFGDIAVHRGKALGGQREQKY